MSWRDRLAAWNQAKQALDAANAGLITARGAYNTAEESTLVAQKDVFTELGAIPLTEKSIASFPAHVHARLSALPQLERVQAVLAVTELLELAQAERWTGFFQPLPIETPQIVLGPVWNRLQAANMSRFSLAQAPGAGGPCYIHTSVEFGDVSNVGGCRTELVASRPEHIGAEGQVRRYRWKTNFPSLLYPIQANAAWWQVWTQWHQRADGPTAQDPVGTPPLEFIVYGNRIVGRTMGDRPDQLIFWDVPLQRDLEYDCDLTVGYSQDPTKGFLQFAVNNSTVLPRTTRRTMVDDQMILKQGLYRHPSIPDRQTVGHRGMVVDLISDSLS